MNAAPTISRHRKAQVTRQLRLLLDMDPRLVAVYQVAGRVLPRVRPPGFEGLARIICGQQVSVASADAIWARLAERQGTTSARAFLSLGEEGVRGVGLSRGKFATICAVARAIESGDLELDAIAGLSADAAMQTLLRHKGIGPWTAEIYLMFCAGHSDIFPAGDIALRRAVGDAFGIEPCPARDVLAAMARDWAPYRATAALLFWRYYAATRRRAALPL